MIKYLLGFIAGVIVCVFTIIAYGFYGPYIEHRLGLCPELTQEETLNLIKRSTVEKILTPQFPDADFEIADNGTTVFITRDGKRIDRNFPIVFCGRVEWSHDQTFRPEQ